VTESVKARGVCREAVLLVPEEYGEQDECNGDKAHANFLGHAISPKTRARRRAMLLGIGKAPKTRATYPFSAMNNIPQLSRFVK